MMAALGRAALLAVALLALGAAAGANHFAFVNCSARDISLNGLRDALEDLQLAVRYGYVSTADLFVVVGFDTMPSTLYVNNTYCGVMMGINSGDAMCFFESNTTACAMEALNDCDEFVMNKDCLGRPPPTGVSKCMPVHPIVDGQERFAVTITFQNSGQRDAWQGNAAKVLDLPCQVIPDIVAIYETDPISNATAGDRGLSTEAKAVVASVMIVVVLVVVVVVALTATKRRRTSFHSHVKVCPSFSHPPDSGIAMDEMRMFIPTHRQRVAIITNDMEMLKQSLEPMGMVPDTEIDRLLELSEANLLQVDWNMSDLQDPLQVEDWSPPVHSGSSHSQSQSHSSMSPESATTALALTAEQYHSTNSPPSSAPDLSPTLFEGPSSQVEDAYLDVLQQGGASLPDECLVTLAVRMGNMEMVRYLLDYGLPTDAFNGANVAPLHVACTMNNIEAAHLLVERGAAINKQDSDGNSPLMFAVHGGHLDMVKFLVDKAKADINLADNEGTTPLIRAVCLGHVDIVELLSSKRACRPNDADSRQRTALHWACAIGDLTMLRTLLPKTRVSIFVRTSDGDTPLHLAAREGSLERVRLITTTGDHKHATMVALVKTPNVLEKTAEQLARDNGFDDVAAYLAHFCDPSLPEPAALLASPELMLHNSPMTTEEEVAAKQKRETHRLYMQARRKRAAEEREQLKDKVDQLAHENTQLMTLVKTARSQLDTLRRFSMQQQ